MSVIRGTLYFMVTFKICFLRVTCGTCKETSEVAERHRRNSHLNAQQRDFCHTITELFATFLEESKSWVFVESAIKIVQVQEGYVVAEVLAREHGFDKHRGLAEGIKQADSVGSPGRSPHLRASRLCRVCVHSEWLAVWKSKLRSQYVLLTRLTHVTSLCVSEPRWQVYVGSLKKRERDVLLWQHPYLRAAMQKEEGNRLSSLSLC